MVVGGGILCIEFQPDILRIIIDIPGDGGFIVIELDIILTLLQLWLITFQTL